MPADNGNHHDQRVSFAILISENDARGRRTTMAFLFLRPTLHATHRLSTSFMKKAPVGKHCDGSGLWLVKRDDGVVQCVSAWRQLFSAVGPYPGWCRRDLGLFAKTLGGYCKVALHLGGFECAPRRHLQDATVCVSSCSLTFSDLSRYSVGKIWISLTR